MTFEYNTKTFSTRYIFGVLEIESQEEFFIWVKTDQVRIRFDVESSEVFHIIDNINIQLGPNWQQSTTKMAVARLTWLFRYISMHINGSYCNQGSA